MSIKQSYNFVSVDWMILAMSSHLILVKSSWASMSFMTWLIS